MDKPKRKYGYSGTPQEVRDKRRESDRRYRAAHKDAVIAKQREWVANNGDRLRATKQAWRDANRDSVRAYAREYAKQWRKDNPELAKAKDKKNYAANAVNQRRYSSEWSKKNRERVKQRRAERNARTPGYDRMISRKWKLANPGRTKQISNSWKIRNAERNKEITQAWHETNPERSKQIRRLAGIARRARLSSAPGSFTYQQFLLRADYHGWVCRYCRCDLAFKTVAVEHMIPLCRGGANWPSNLVPCCKSCNSKKNKKTYNEYITLLRKLRPECTQPTEQTSHPQSGHRNLVASGHDVLSLDPTLQQNLFSLSSGPA
jgi:5-methylcytosine-specific restriction endonuclease McrA